MKKHTSLILLLILSIQIFAQDPFQKYNPKIFEIVKFKGKIGKFPITMILTFYPYTKDVSGYYLYDNAGRFINVMNQKNEKRPWLITSDFEYTESNYREYFQFIDSLQIHKSIAKGQWVCNKDTLPLILTRDSTMPDWKLLRLKSIGYFNDSYFNTQTRDYSIIYPSVKSSPILNNYFLKNSIENKTMLDFINTSNCNYLIIDQNFGENSSENEDCCWSDDFSSELLFASDSIITYKTNSFTYGNNGYSSETITSVKVSNGEVIKISTIINDNSIDTVLKTLNNKYKEVLIENSNENMEFEFSKYSNVYITPKGMYFRDRLGKLDPYIDVFLSFKEISKYLNEDFKKFINCP